MIQNRLEDLFLALTNLLIVDIHIVEILKLFMYLIKNLELFITDYHDEL